MSPRFAYSPSLVGVLFLAVGASALVADRADARRPYEPPVMVRPVPPKQAYRIDLIAENGQQLPTFRRRGATYVLGARGQRYSIRVTNPTNRRVEAVVSVDGLDVIDGRPANHAHKRGYVIGPHGNVKIDGFRVSQEQVAAFRFSSVGRSYAGLTGNSVARVGFINVAIFEESRPLVMIPRPRPYPHRHWRGQPTSGASPSASKANSRRPPRVSAKTGRAGMRPDYRYRRPVPRPHQPGLGTQFGEYRSSGVRFTTFTRKHSSRPDFFASLRYDNRAGLVSLGVLPPSRVHIIAK